MHLRRLACTMSTWKLGSTTVLRSAPMPKLAFGKLGDGDRLSTAGHKFEAPLLVRKEEQDAFSRNRELCMRCSRKSLVRRRDGLSYKEVQHVSSTLPTFTPLGSP